MDHPRQLRRQPGQLPSRVGLLQKIDFFFGEIQRRFHQHAQLDQAVAQGVNLSRKRAAQ